MGVFSHSEHAENWYIADNVIVGRNSSWNPRTEPGRGYMEPSHTGVNIYGQGHVVAHNTITRFSDALAINNFNLALRDYDPEVRGPLFLAVNIDFHHNDLSWAQDDIIEADYGCNNIRVYRNRGYNAWVGLSVQPSYGGPIYLIRNEMYAVARPFKLHNHPTGVVAYHNTGVGQGSGIRSQEDGHKMIFRNNVILGGTGWGYAFGTISPHTSLDYNAISHNRPGGLLIEWFDGKERRRFATLEKFTKATGHECHGMLVDYDIFMKARRMREHESLAGPDEFDLRLRPGSAPVDAGVRLPNVNDDHTGAAPDLGAHELGQPLPHYGPRPERGPRW